MLRHNLGLDVADFAPAELELAERHARLLEEAQEAELRLVEDQKGVAPAALAARRAADAVDVLLKVHDVILKTKYIAIKLYQ